MIAGLFRTTAAVAPAARLPRSRGDGVWIPLATALLAAAGYYAGAKLGLALTFSPHPISVLWPPNAILLAALLLTPVRSWWFILAAVFPVHLLAELQDGVPATMVLCWFVSNASEALIGAATVRWAAKGVPTFDTLADIAVFIVCAAFLAPFLSSFLDAGFVILNAWGQSGYWDVWRTRFIANTLATLTLVPVIVTWSRLSLSGLRAQHPGRWIEGAALAFGLLATAAFVFEFQYAASGALPPMLYLVMPFLLWAAFRFGTPGASAALLAVALMAIWGSAHGRGPFSSGAPLVDALAVQLFLVFVTVLVLSLAAAMTERRRTVQALRQSEEQYREVVETQTDLVCRYLPDTTLTFVNSAYCRFFGRTREELIGRPLTELVPESAHGFIRDYIAKLAQDRRPATVEHQVMARDGSLRWQQWVDHAIVGPDGTVTEFQGIGRDITDRKATEETLRASDERFQLVLQATNAVIYDWDVATDTLWWSQNGLNLFGYVDDERRDYAWWSGLLHAEDREVTAQRLKRAIAGNGSQWDAEYRLRRRDGSYAHVTDRGYMLRDADGAPMRMIGSLLDVTDHKHLQEVNDRLLHASGLAVLGELSASIAHEINQPLGAILSNADAAEMLLAADPLPLDELRQIVEDIRRDDMRAGEIVRHMRSLLRRRELTIQPFDFNQAISDVVNFVGADLRRHGVTVDTEFAPLPIAHGDQAHLQQVVLNLILNGVDAMKTVPASRRQLRIRTARSEAGGIEVTVGDSGPGIAPEVARRLFDSFYTTKPDGMGLGLSIARSIMEAHGGSIHMEARSGEGASFRMFLPARPAQTGRAPSVTVIGGQR